MPTDLSTPAQTGFDPVAFRNTCGAFGTGVTIVTTKLDQIEYGMTVNAFMSISLDPPLIAISVAKTAKILGQIRKSGRYAVSILKDSAEETALHFAGRSNDNVQDPFRQLDGLPVVREACAVFTTHVDQAIEAGDHVIFIGRVSVLQSHPDTSPLMFHKGRFGRLQQDPAGDLIAPEFFLETAHW